MQNLWLRIMREAILLYVYFVSAQDETLKRSMKDDAKGLEREKEKCGDEESNTDWLGKRARGSNLVSVKLNRGETYQVAMS